MTEGDEQKALIQWLDLKHIAYFAPPSSFFAKKKDAKFFGMIASMKKMGWSSGFPDIVIFLEGEIVLIEMKRSQGGKVSDAQAEWHRVLGVLDHPVYVCNGLNEAILAIEQHL